MQTSVDKPSGTGSPSRPSQPSSPKHPLLGEQLSWRPECRLGDLHQPKSSFAVQHPFHFRTSQDTPSILSTLQACSVVWKCTRPAEATRMHCSRSEPLATRGKKHMRATDYRGKAASCGQAPLQEIRILTPGRQQGNGFSGPPLLLAACVPKAVLAALPLPALTDRGKSNKGSSTAVYYRSRPHYVACPFATTGQDENSGRTLCKISTAMFYSGQSLAEHPSLP